jgi:flagellar hook-associated protein 1 FlgK
MSLLSTLNSATQALNAATGAIQITNNNIANADTAGYTREIAIFKEADDTQYGGYSLGNGVDFEGYQSVRNELLQGQVLSETSAQSGANASLTTLQTLETTFDSSSSTSNIGNEISALFSSLSEMSTDPTSSTLRNSVMNSAQSLVTAFHSAASTLSSEQSGLDSEVSDEVSQINSLSQQIAALNPKIVAKESSSGSSDAGTLQDQQDELILKLSALTNVNVIQTTDGVTITTGSGTALVVGKESYTLKTGTNSSGLTSVEDQYGSDITDSLTTGELGGILTTRDQTIPGLQSQLDTLAYDMGTAFNTVQAAGYDQDGNTGTDFFTLPSSSDGAASAIEVALSDGTGIAASTDGSSGGSDNLTSLLNIQNTKLSSGSTASDTYSSLVYQVGSITSDAQSEASASSATLTQLNDQIDSVSGVSIDEEATNLIQYQQAYAAAAHVVSTIQTLFTTLMDAVS